MSIESYLAQEKNNIPASFKKVAGRLLAEKEKNDERPWKWEEEVSENDWKEMDDVLEKIRKRPDWDQFAHMAVCMRMLDPQHPIPLDAEVWKGMNEKLKEHRKRISHLDQFARLASGMRFLDPRWLLPLNEEVWDGMRKRLHYLKNRDEWDSVVKMTLHMNILDHNHPTQLDTLTRSCVEEKLKYDGNVLGVKELIVRAGVMRLLDPRLWIHFDKDLWKQMSVELHELMIKRFIPSDFNRYRFAEVASAMRILAAHKVEVGDEGVGIIDNATDQLDVTLPPRPVRKKIK